MKKIIGLLCLAFLFPLNLNVNAFAIADVYSEKSSILENGIIDDIIDKEIQQSNVNDEMFYYTNSVTFSKKYFAELLATDYVYTPNGSPVLVHCFKELTESEINEMNQEGDTLVPEATRIAPSTSKYNCHSYAWYMQSTSNPYWMSDPSSYYTDWSYEESDGNIGEIICYFNSDGFNLHSGVIIDELEGVSNGVCGDSNLFTVRSKWGAGGLYDHRGDQCPYTQTYKGTASYVKYYKLHNHTYTYAQADSGHTATCVDCGYTTTLDHNYVEHYCTQCNAYTTTHDYDRNYEWVNYINHNVECCCGEKKLQGHAISAGSYSGGSKYATCLLCGGFAEKGFSVLTINSSAVTQVTMNGSFILPNGVIVLVDEDLEAYFNGTLVFYDKDKVPVVQ